MEYPSVLMMVILMIIENIEKFITKSFCIKWSKSSETIIVFLMLIFVISGGVNLAAPAEQSLHQGEARPSLGSGLELHLDLHRTLLHPLLVVIISDASRVETDSPVLGESIDDDIVTQRRGSNSQLARHLLDVDLVHPDQCGVHRGPCPVLADAQARDPRLSLSHVDHVYLLPGEVTLLSQTLFRHVRGREPCAPEASITSECVTQRNEPRRRAGRGRAPDNLGNVLNPKTLIGYAARGRPATAASTETGQDQNRFCVSIHSSHNLPGRDSRHRNGFLSRVIKLYQTRPGRDTGGKMARQGIGPILAILGAGHGCGRVCTPLGQPGVSKLKQTYQEGGRHDEITTGKWLDRSFKSEEVAGEVTL